MNLNISMIRPASRERPDRLAKRLPEFESRGHRVSFVDTKPDPAWPYTAASREDRLAQLVGALQDENIDIVWAARGGYGVSDLLPDIPWSSLNLLQPKILIGFSDISSLHAALWTKCGWSGLHAPMPATTLWPESGGADTQALWSMLESRKYRGELPVIALRGAEMTGWLFGGCLSVLTNLIGTPYLPTSLAGACLFFEDTDENPGRLLRHLNQWQQAGLLEGVRGIILGSFRNCGVNPENEALFKDEVTRRFEVPIFSTDSFGHVSPNFPIMIGAQARIVGDKCVWELQQKEIA